MFAFAERERERNLQIYMQIASFFWDYNKICVSSTLCFMGQCR